MSAFAGRTLLLFNECTMACRYCGYPPATTRPVDLAALAADARALRASGVDTVVVASKDPAEHPQFGEILSMLLGLFGAVHVETAGLALHAARGREGWATDRRVKWKVPLVSELASVHDRIVGRPGHHQVVVDLLGDARLDVQVQTLLVRDVLADGNLARTTALADQYDRDVALRHFTPRDPGSPDYYRDNVPRVTDLWRALPRAVSPRKLQSFLEINPQCFPPCVVPEPLQERYFEQFARAVRPGGEALADSSLEDVDPCPRQAACGFGAQCLGLHALYTAVHGDEEFRPENVDRAALDRFLGGPAAAAASAARDVVRQKRSVLVGLRLRDGARLRADREQEAAVRQRAESATLRERLSREGFEAVRPALEAFERSAPEEVVREVGVHARLTRVAALIERSEWTRAMELLAGEPAPHEAAWTELHRCVRQGQLFAYAVRMRRSRPSEAVRALRAVLQLTPGEPHALRMLRDLGVEPA